MGDLSDLISQAHARIAQTELEKGALMFTLGELDREIAQTTRHLAHKERERATVHFARPRTEGLDIDLGRLNYDVDRLRDTLKVLEDSKVACLVKMRELDGKLAGDRRVVEVCETGRSI